MTKDELDQQIKAIDTEASNKKTVVYKAYADAHNTVKVDDIVTDSIGSIKVDKIGYYKPHLSSIPCECTYEGVELKKDLTPKKNSPKRLIYQSNLIH